MKFIIFILLAAILISLGGGLFYLSGRNHDSKKVQYALRIRIVLSAILIRMAASRMKMMSFMVDPYWTGARSIA